MGEGGDAVTENKRWSAGREGGCIIVEGELILKERVRWFGRPVKVEYAVVSYMLAMSTILR